MSQPTPLNAGLSCSAAPRAAYVHVPFCSHRCGYCNFTLVAGRDDLMEAYLQAIERELSQLHSPRQVDTLFLGGGTPTRLGAKNLRRLFAILDRWFPRAPGYELSVEANPVDCHPALADTLAQCGVTRVSLGVQSFDAGKLQVLERDHRRQEILAACENLRFFDVLSLDLIFGAPGERLDVWIADLEQALQRRPDHVSTYGLTFEQGTSFWSRRRRGVLLPVDESLEREMYITALDRLVGAGMEHYEVSNFAFPGRRCRHNETYWLGHGYYAAGPGAARYIDGRREVNHRSTTTYLKRVLAGQSPVAESEQLPPEESARERLIFGLRRMDGVRRGEFQRATSFDLDDLAGDALRWFVAEGWIEDTGDCVRLTREGLLISDSLWPDLLAAK